MTEHRCICINIGLFRLNIFKNRVLCVTHDWHTPSACHIYYEWVMAHTWTSHVTHMNESCHIYEWVMAHIWMSHGTHGNTEGVLCATLMRDIPPACHTTTHEWVMTHIRMRHVIRMNESCHTFEWVMSHIWIHMCALIHESYLCVYICIYIYIHIYIFFLYIHMYSHLCVTYPLHVTRTHMNESWQTYEWVMSHAWMSQVTHMNESCHTYEWVVTDDFIWMGHGRLIHRNTSEFLHRNSVCHRMTHIQEFLCMSLRISICRISYGTLLNESTVEWLIHRNSFVWVCVFPYVECAMVDPWMSHFCNIYPQHVTQTHVNESG